MIRTLQSEFQDLVRDIRELKTAQPKPSIIQAHYKTGERLSGYYTVGDWTWTITYKDDGSGQAPVTMFESMPYVGAYLKPYVSNQQKILWHCGEYQAVQQGTFTLVSTREILSITQDQTPIQHEWTQVRDFYPQDMGTTPGWCLQNCRLGFHIYSGTFPNAVSDMQSQRNNGTLHPFNGATETPPDYIACPVYINIRGVADGHVCVWDHGTIWNDGYTVPKFTDMGGYIEVWGWGELCDGARVVQHV